MEVKEALEKIEQIKFDVEHFADWKEMREPLSMAIAALKKQIPIKPIRKSWELPRCPSCGAALGEWLEDGYTEDWENKTVCDCGQKIDWS